MKKSMKPAVILRALAATLTVLILLPCLFSCGDSDTVSVKKVVGTVGDVEITYDELYFLAINYGEATKGEELDRLIRENVITNAAILMLCERNGLTYREKDFKDEIDEEIAATVEESFNGDRDAYLEAMRAYGLTESYLRYSTGLELLYGQLLDVYPEKGLVPSDEDAVLAYIRENFIHVYHVAIFNDKDDDAVANRSRMEDAYEKLSSGEYSMYDLIRRGYSEDVSDPAGNGYYISKGSTEKAYEDAAFALAIGEHSGIVESMGENNLGEYVSCYYLIQRFELDETYLDTHYYELSSAYYGSVISGDLAEIEAELSFTPNEFYLSLDLDHLLPPREHASFLLPLIISISVGVVLIGGSTAIVLILKAKHRKKNLSYTKKQEKKKK